MKIFVFVLVFIYSSLIAQSWKRPEVASQWYFGKGAGLDFRSGVPVGVQGSLCAWEGVSTYCDFLGNLLFYTDGIKVYNNNHQLMQNGDSLGAGYVQNFSCSQTTDLASSTQGPIIIPKKYNSFYIFTTNCMEDGTTGYKDDPTQYSIVDMQADSGRGAVVQKNIMIHPRGTEKQAAIRHANGRDWWHLFHVANSDSFGVGLINDSLQYQFLKTGSFVWNTEDSSLAFGEMRFNWQGNMLVNLVGREDSSLIDFFNFDRKQGTLTLIPDLGQALQNQLYLFLIRPNIMKTYVYSACFSPNGDYLYFSLYEYNPLQSHVFQFDLKNKNLNRIYLSPNTTPSSYGQFHLAKNGIIYFTQIGSCVLPVIQSPDLNFPACSFSLGGISTQFPLINCTRQANYGLQNAAVFADPELTSAMSLAQGAGCGEVVFTDSSGGHFYRLWDFGDGAWSDTLAVTQSAEFLGLTDSFQVIHHTYTDTGWFQVRLFLLHSDTLSDTLTQWIHISNCQLTATENEYFCPQPKAGMLSIYPNPNNGEFVIKGLGCESYEIVDLTGKVLQTSTLQANESTQAIETHDLAKGVYILHIQTEKEVKTLKLMIE